MNTTGTDQDDRAWRDRLRAADVAPAHTPDLWPAIAARLEPRLPTHGSVPLSALGTRRSRPLVRRRAILQSAFASACLLMLVVLALPLRPPAVDGSAPLALQHPLDLLLLREADALDREYAAAFAQFEGAPVSSAFEPGLQALDAEGRRLHAALEQSPHQLRLLEELRRVHERRLQLLRRGLELNA